MSTILGLDVGGSGIKGALVNIETGELVAPRHRLPTPEAAKPAAVGEVLKQLTLHFQYSGPVGIGFPSVIRHGVILTAANVDSSWIGLPANEFFGKAIGMPAHALNDADAAGIAEMAFGAGRAYHTGVVLLLTVGTGIGSAVFVNGHLLPNTEFGHIQIRGKDAERRASDAARQRKKLSWEQWATRFEEYLETMCALISPDIIILGGGVSRKMDKFMPHIKVDVKIIPAELENDAGIVGAAMFAAHPSA
ncbi:MAG TPA: ROK family protein [Anaerolineaceae bacterium]|jgi:polyphosphate glucokinase|nr:ROK family protein [Longilinea sp.]HNZ13386.1 ROK family protein [Anaerolineaceae bacterium]HOG79137.1 ROK family protein [Anaerolineaceae bacterium]HQF63040.1 ROK family protein [Anaerolineaceae bacterium]HQH86026.1 ROK family protein [Anaerolineaceae bacterium]